ncbi:hypothetical protein TWF730_007063 [Orbilia blumenaviensis]|uniref:CCL2-like lectin domain-containing protein n=1 Tax=Orbilia blumenaviensis TaxID=1796055 RepID=A0AAV9VII6_9PEZI
MTRPAPGDYIIYNRVLSCSGQKLAITYCNKGGPVTVTPLTQLREQIWTIKNYSDGKTQHIIPKKDDNLEVGWGKTGAVVIPPGNYVWTIRDGDDGYTIQDGARTKNWGVEKAVANTKVCISVDRGSPYQRWVLQKVKTSGDY